MAISVNPCTAKKAETKREEENAAARFHNDDSIGMDTDISITTRDLSVGSKRKTSTSMLLKIPNSMT